MTKVQRESKKVQFCQRILAIAMRESDANGLLPNTKLSEVFTDSLEWLDFIHKLGSEIGPLSDEEAVKAETFMQLAECYAIRG